MTEQEQREANRHVRIVEILLGAVLTVAIAFGGWTVNQFIGIHTRLGNVETRLDHVEARLSRIENALNILVARKNGADEENEESETLIE